MNTKILFGCAALLATALTAVSPSASYAQGAADRPINVIIPFAPGGGTDVLARRIMPKIAEKLGTTVAIENKPGASGSIGAQFVARAAPDGKTLLVGSVSEIGINPGLYPKLPYNVERDFVAVTALAAAPMVLVVHPTSAVKSAGDLVRLAKESPGKINF
ncbi:MAG: Bug family tripartite tricarboxylate transporter substrate binding protein, partial [Betaproteobacteria bacterium]